MKRAAGVLLAVSSLPSKYGIGCFDKEAYDLVDRLAEAGQTYWQILPLGPTGYGPSADSPYQSYSAFAGNPYFISLDDLIEEGVLTKEACDAVDFGDDPQTVDYEKLNLHRRVLLRRAYERSDITKNEDYCRFAAENDWWLDDYALFMALKERFGQASWHDWPEDIRLRWGNALDYYRRELYFDIEFWKFLQFHFFRQWEKLKAYANARHIKIIGDIPIYVSPDSADIWAQPELFQLEDDRTPGAVAGCPPDDFCADGQLWGNPLYRWDYHKRTDYHWWITRLWASFRLYDVIRIDHFRGLDEYFSIPYGAETAIGGHWEKGPGMELMNKIFESLPGKQLIAEDLGYMTPSVRQLVKDSGIPNMKVLQFAFGAEDIGGANDHLPHNYRNNCVAYTGTHDNETLAGWIGTRSKEDLVYIRNYLNDSTTPDAMLHERLIDLAMMSCADTCIIPMQDYLGLGNESRMNQPATVGKNWKWRMKKGAFTAKVGKSMLERTMRYGRMNWESREKEQEV
ncbi:MAG: 4-alpha-glucanotransferase [Oscillospiraceae bacterium]|nr:4-alpha-glucanotransferase [Oscillospiraceae bacterium]